MPLHLVKLCVGADTVDDLRGWIEERLAERRRANEPPEHRHTTRMVPKRAADLLDGGSLYWVIRGEVAARQTLRGVEPFTGPDGIGRCHLVLDPAVVVVEPRPRRPFQGWRYLRPEDAPADVDAVRADVAALPAPMRRVLRDLGLL